MGKEDIPWNARNHIYVMMLRGDYLKFDDTGCDYENGLRVTASRYSVKKNPTKEDIKEWVDELKISEGPYWGEMFAKQMQSMELK